MAQKRQLHGSIGQSARLFDHRSIMLCRKNDLRAAVLKELRNLLRRVMRVEGNGDRSDAQNSQIGRAPCDVVVRQDGTSVFWLNLVRAQESGSRVCFFLKDRKSTRLNSSHLGISYAVFCLKKK